MPRLHVVGDTISSVAVVVSAVVIYLTGWRIINPITTVLIGLVIVFGGSVRKSFMLDI